VDVTAICATFGDEAWVDLARSRAIPTAEQQARVVHVHGDNLRDARNAALGRVETEWMFCLDADDELTGDYVAALLTGTADVRGPIARCFLPPPDGRVVKLHPRVSGHEHPHCGADCLRLGNWLVTGAMARTELVRKVGGWRDFSWMEDWDLWLRCLKVGATFELIEEAVYVYHVRNDSLTHVHTEAERQAQARLVYGANFDDEYVGP
jgi:Glycosyl transferase family group 2